MSALRGKGTLATTRSPSWAERSRCIHRGARPGCQHITGSPRPRGGGPGVDGVSTIHLDIARRRGKIRGLSLLPCHSRAERPDVDKGEASPGETFPVSVFTRGGGGRSPRRPTSRVYTTPRSLRPSRNRARASTHMIPPRTRMVRMYTLPVRKDWKRPVNRARADLDPMRRT